MKFLKHILTGWFILWTLAFNIGIIVYFYELFFHPEYFYEGMSVIGTIIILGIYSAYWLYCINTFKDKK